MRTPKRLIKPKANYQPDVDDYHSVRRDYVLRECEAGRLIGYQYTASTMYDSVERIPTSDIKIDNALNFLDMRHWLNPRPHSQTFAKCALFPATSLANPFDIDMILVTFVTSWRLFYAEDYYQTNAVAARLILR